MNITVFSVNLCAYDNVRPPLYVESGVEYILFADEGYNCPPWRVVPFPQPYGSASRNSRIPKILPHLFFDTEYSIYHDGCLQMAVKPSALVDELLQGADLAMYKHPCRKSVHEEMDCCQRFGIGYSPEMRAQVARYRAHGLGDELWAGGVLIRRHTDLVTLFNETWWREYRDGCSRDQFALAFARHSVGLRVNPIPGDILQDAKRFQFLFHADFAHLGDNPQYADERKRRAEKQRRLEGLL
jgi:hypothetical protein